MVKINILINTDKSYIPKVEYVFNFFCKILGLLPVYFYDATFEDIHIYYGSYTPNNEKHTIIIYHNEQAINFFNKKLPFEENNMHFIKYRKHYIPFLFSQTGEIYRYQKDKMLIRKDIVASAFFFLTCWQEYLEEGLEFENTLPFKWNFNLIPVVDYYCDIVHKALSAFLANYERQKKWADTFQAAVSIGKILSPDKIPNQFFKNIGSKLFKTNPDYTAKDTLFIPHLPDKKDQTDFWQNNSDILSETTELSVYFQDCCEGETVVESVKSFNQRGYEIAGVFVNNYKKHYLNLIPHLKELPIKFDTSITFPEGFRAGTSYPYYPYNIKEDKQLNILEIPISFAKFSAENKKNSCKRYLRSIVEETLYKKSHFALIWYFVPDKNEFYFHRMIKKLRKQNFWVVSLSELYLYWMER